MLALVLHGVLFFADPAAPPDTSSTPRAEQTSRRNELNLLGAVDSAAGESRRNENVQFNLIDNNALKDLNIRLGTNATIVTEFHPDRKYFGTEFGNNPASPIHLNSLTRSARFPWRRLVHSLGQHLQRPIVLSGRRSAAGARKQLRIHGRLRTVARRSPDARGLASKQLRGSVNGNVLVPLAVRADTAHDRPRDRLA